MQISFDTFTNYPEFRNPFRSEEISIGFEPATECDGEACGLTSYDGHAMPNIQPSHWHIVVRGTRPNAGPPYFAI
jgi:hypothetical protein